MNPKCPEARNRDDEPFEGMKISSFEALDLITERSSCSRCCKSRMFFCYTCFLPVPQLQGRIPVCKVRILNFTYLISINFCLYLLYNLQCNFQLPIKVDIVKHKREIDGKSTAAHAAVLAPDYVNVYTYPEMPDYDLKKTVLLYPGAEAKSVSQLFEKESRSGTYSQKLLAELPSGYNVGTLMKKIFTEEHTINQIFHVKELPIDKVVLIDSTWNQSRGIFADERLQKIPKIVLQNRPSQFWRHQKGSPRWYLSTVEALHQLMLELHLCAWGRNADYKSHLTAHFPIHSPQEHVNQCQPYMGQYDDLLYFFKYMYQKLHTLYKHEDMLAYKRPMI